jgi:hypothetical protein
MEVKKELLGLQSKAQLRLLAIRIGQNPERFADLMALFLGLETKLIQRAAAVMTICGNKHPQLFQPYLDKLVLHLQQPTLAAPVKRNILRILQHQQIPRDLQGFLAGFCFDYLNAQEPPAIKAFTLTVLANLARTEPDLNNELKLVIEDQWPYASPAFKSRASKILAAMKKGRR